MRPSAPVAEVTGDTYIDVVPRDSFGGDGMLCARIAMYDSYAAAPRIQDVAAPDERKLIDELSNTVYSAVRELGGTAPYTVLKEIVENLIHADFREIVVSIMDNGATIRFSDQGPGIPDKHRAVLPGFTTASADAKHFIRGVGSGLPIVSEFIEHSGGSLSLEDNLGTGTVVTLALGSLPSNPEPAPDSSTFSTMPTEPCASLSLRQKKVLSLVLEFGEAGPTLVSKELSVGLSTAYRDLAFLEDNDLIQADESGKRVITAAGVAYLDALFS